MADDAQEVVAALELRRYVLAGRCMDGKVTQIVAARGAKPPSACRAVA